MQVEIFMAALLAQFAAMSSAAYAAYMYGSRSGRERAKGEREAAEAEANSQMVIEFQKARHEKEYAYYERNMVVALYVKTLQYLGQAGKGKPFTVGVNVTPGFGRWSRCLYIDTPMLGQVSWHFHDSHSGMLRPLGLPSYHGEWDGRNKHEKYAAVSKFLESSTK